MPKEDPCIFAAILGRETWGDRPALLGMQTTTYGALLSATEQFAQVLRSRGVRPGTLVGICLPNSREYIITLLAIYLAGGISVLLNPNAPVDEKRFIQSHSGMTFLVIQEQKSFLEKMYQVQKIIWDTVVLLGPFPGNDSESTHDDCLLIYTSGSTNVPKGVMLTKSSISSNVRAVADYLALAPFDRTIVFTPSSYAYAVSQYLTHLWSGGAVFPFAFGLLYPAHLLQTISEYGITGIAANPTIFRLLNATIHTQSYALDQVRYVMSGGQALESNVAYEIARNFPQARIVNMYGCTENSPRISFYWLPAAFLPRSTPWPVGQPVREVGIRIINETGADVPQGQVGQILVSGPSVMRCYWREATLTAERLVDGWFQTGDQGFFDQEGNLSLTGREDNIINVGHEKVAPEEVEMVIATIEGVKDVGVAPLDDPLLGQSVVALVIVDTQPPDILHTIQVICHQRLSAAKRPRQIVSVKTLPRTPYGKLDRRQLRTAAQHLILAPQQRSTH